MPTNTLASYALSVQHDGQDENRRGRGEDYDIIGRTYLFEAKDVFDSYCIYLEWNRAPEKKFYQPDAEC